MAVKTASQASKAKKFLKDRAAQMESAVSDGVQNMKLLAAKGRKIIEHEAQSATNQSAEDMLKGL